jgi:spermidine/putrescine transport system permease protein
MKEGRHRGISQNNTWLMVHSGMVYLFLYLPILILILFSFNRSRQTAHWKGFTWDWYTKLWENEALMNAIGNSLTIAFVTCLVATVFGTLLALAMQRHAFRGKAATQSLIYAPLVTPEVVLGAALVMTFGLIQFQLGLTTVILAHIGFSITYVVIVIRARLEGFDHSMEEAARDLGAGSFQTFTRVTLPLIFPGVLSAALIVFTISLDDYVITSFVAGVGSTTLPLQIYSMIKVGVTPEVNAISSLLLVFTVILIVTAEWLQRPMRNRWQGR